MSELYCSNCKKLLSNDEKASGKCANCGEKFSSTLIGATRPIEVNTDIATEKNIVGMVLKVIGILILIVGTITNFILIDKYEYEYTIFSFIVPELRTIVSGMILIGSAEIVKLLQHIKNRMR